MTKRRFRRPPRTRERGATLFVVVLAITLLTGVGLYTVHSSSLSARAAGNGREALQAQRVGEAFAVAALTNLRFESWTKLHAAWNPTFPCEMNYGLPEGKCHKLKVSELTPPTGAAILAADSFGSSTPLGGGARVEITDVYAASIPNPGGSMSASGGSSGPNNYYTGTVTIIASLNHSSAMGAVCVQDVMQVTGQSMIRSHLLFGPMGEI